MLSSHFEEILESFVVDSVCLVNIPDPMISASTFRGPPACRTSTNSRMRKVRIVLEGFRVGGKRLSETCKDGSHELGCCCNLIPLPQEEVDKPEVEVDGVVVAPILLTVIRVFLLPCISSEDLSSMIDRSFKDWKDVFQREKIDLSKMENRSFKDEKLPLSPSSSLTFPRASRKNFSASTYFPALS